MKQNCKHLLLLLILCSISSISMGQIKKEGPSKSSFTLLSDADGGFVVQCSANGDYVIIGLGENAAVLWQRSTGTYTPLFTEEIEAIANDVNDSGVVVGSFTDPTITGGDRALLSAGYWKNGTWYRLPYPEGYVIPGADYGSTAYGISHDGRTIVGCIYLVDRPKMPYTACVWVDGKFDRYYELPWDESMGGRPNGIAGDGKSAPGWAEKAYNDTQFAYRAPLLFGQKDTATPITSILRSTGEMYALNYDGSKGCGYLPNGPFLWDKASGDIKYLGFLSPSHANGSAVDLSENNTVVGYTFEDMPDTRRAFIWKEDIGMINLTTYASEVYGLDLDGEEFLQAVGISADGRIIYGNTLMGTPFVLLLDGEILPTTPNVVNATPMAGGKSIQVTWRRPVENGMLHIGYNVYRDGEKINETMLSKETLSYVDLDASVGNHCYAVSAVFEVSAADLESKLSAPSCVQVLGDNTCYSVKTTSSTLLYNQIYTVNWSVPSAYLPKNNTDKSDVKSRTDAQIRKMSPMASEKGQDNSQNNAPQRSYIEHPDTLKSLDFVTQIPLTTMTEASIAVIGDYIYAASWNLPAGIYKYDLHGNYVEMFVPSCGTIDELTTDGTYLYAVNKEKKIYKIDVVAKDVIAEIPVSQAPSHICYIPTLDGGNGGFEYGVFDMGFLCKKDGTFIDTAFTGAVGIAGTTYYDGFIYAMEQSGATSFKAQINQYSLETKKFVKMLADLADYSQLSDIEEAFGGGLAVGKSIDGTLCLMAILQDPTGNSVVMLELEKPEGLTGYNVYRNGEKIASDYPYRNYQQLLQEPGQYDYYVTAQWGDCESDTSTHQNVTILPKGECSAPRNLEASSTFNHIDITWDAPLTSPEQTFVGYILYDGEGNKLTQDLITTNRYTAIVPGEGTYKYSVEAFYASSCEARTETVTVDVQFIGECLPVNNLQAKYVETQGVNLTWEAPYFDHPIAMRYDDGVFADAIGITEGGEFMAAIGWLKKDMTLYKDFVMVGLEAFIASVPRSISLLVIIDDTIVVEQSIATSTLRVGEFNYFKLENPILFDAGIDFAVGFRVDNKPQEFPLGIDHGPAKVGFGDLISANNGESWESILYGNWLMAAAITKYRDISPSTTSFSNVQKVSSFTNLDKTTNTVARLGRSRSPLNAQSKAEALKLKGYNVYKADKKLNETILTVTNYNDKNISSGESYTYQVASVWEDCDELKESITINCVGMESENDASLTIYPNPATTVLNIQTLNTINQLRLFDMSGREVLQQGNVNRIDVSKFNAGLYLLKIETNGKTYTRKINILK